MTLVAVSCICIGVDKHALFIQESGAVMIVSSLSHGLGLFVPAFLFALFLLFFFFATMLDFKHAFLLCLPLVCSSLPP